MLTIYEEIQAIIEKNYPKKWDKTKIQIAGRKFLLRWLRTIFTGGLSIAGMYYVDAIGEKFPVIAAVIAVVIIILSLVTAITIPNLNRILNEDVKNTEVVRQIIRELIIEENAFQEQKKRGR